MGIQLDRIHPTVDNSSPELDSFLQYYSEIWRPGDPISREWHPIRYEQAIRTIARDACYLIKSEDDGLVGAAAMRPVSREEMHTSTLVIDERFRNQPDKRYGSQAIQLMRRMAYDDGYTEMTLASPERTIHFYERLGFRVRSVGHTAVMSMDLRQLEII